MDGGFNNINEAGGVLNIGLKGMDSLTDNEMLEDSKEDSCSQYNQDDNEDTENSCNSPDLLRTQKIY